MLTTHHNSINHNEIYYWQLRDVHCKKLLESMKNQRNPQKSTPDCPLEFINLLVYSNLKQKLIISLIFL